MGFPRSIKEKMMVAAARHCCVCHRYKGVKVEIHHIVQEADGGKNTLKNAITLCFDCHADAGHYNSRHPRGTKFSPAELRLAKESWLKIVAENKIVTSTDTGDFHCRYYICKNFETLSKVAASDLSTFPVSKPLLVKNDVLSLLQDIIRRHPHTSRNGRCWGKKFRNKDEYLENYPNIEFLSHGGFKYPYFNEVRKVQPQELDQFRVKDGVVDAMVEHGVSVSTGVSVVGCYESGCEGVEFLEEYLFRDLWCAFLAVKNVANKPVSLDVLTASTSQGVGFQNFSPSSLIVESIDLPATPICPGETVLIPLAVILPPIYPYKVERMSSESVDRSNGCYQAVTHCAMDQKVLNDFLIYGGTILPNELSGKGAQGQFEQPVHKLDLTNFYEIDMHWACGSCPHLFFQYDRLVYVRELLAHCENRTGVDRFVIPESVSKIVVAELEDEVAEIDLLTVDKTIILSGLRLAKGEQIEIDVYPGASCEVIGQYRPKVAIQSDAPMGRIRNSLIYEFLNSCAEV